MVFYPVKLIPILLLILSANCDFSENDIDERNYLDTTVNPCDDFYKFTCGNFKNIHPRPSTLNIVDHFTILTDELTQLGQEILSYPRTAEDPVALKKAKAAYNACVKTIPKLTAPELETIKEFNGFPLVTASSQEETQFSWNEIGDMVAEYGVPLIFSFSVVQTEQIDSVIYIGSDPLSNPSLFRPEYQNQKSYYDVLEESFKEMGSNKIEKRSTQLAPFDVFLQTVSFYLRDQVGSNKTDEDVVNDINDMANLMRQIYAGGISGDLVPLQEFPATIKELQNWTDTQFNGESPINWIQYLSHVFQKTNVNITEETKLYYYQGLDTFLYGILNLIKQTDPNIVKNFALLRILLFQASDSDGVVRQAFEDYYKAKNYALYERREYCTRQVLDVVGTAGLSYAVTYAYKQYHYNNNKILKAYELISNITNTFKKDINGLAWMDEESRNVAILKANNILALLAYPDFVENENALDTFYENLPICEWNNYGNARYIRAFRQAYQFSQLENTDRGFWGKSAFDPNAYYNRPNNKIVIPIAMLNPVFFYGDNYLLDYSRLGSVIGHEISHGFDVNGKNYDQDGLLNAWWTEETMASFLERANCFRSQYSEYYVPQINVSLNGDSSINENIADAGGVRVAFSAFKALADSQNFKATGNYTLEQLFFIGYGTMWCGDESNNYLQAITTASNTYPPKKYRVIGSLSNMVEFADAFQCPVGSRMNPENKCLLW